MVDFAECRPEIRGLIFYFDAALSLLGDIKWVYFILRKSGFSVSSLPTDVLFLMYELLLSGLGAKI